MWVSLVLVRVLMVLLRVRVLLAQVLLVGQHARLLLVG
jgi:hypothetical protein